MLSMAWPVALGPATPSPSPAAGLAGPAGASAAALALGVAEALPLDGGGAGGDGGRAAGAAAIHAARLEDALLLEVACNILEQVLRFASPNGPNSSRFLVLAFFLVCAFLWLSLSLSDSFFCACRLFLPPCLRLLSSACATRCGCKWAPCTEFRWGPTSAARRPWPPTSLWTSCAAASRFARTFGQERGCSSSCCLG